MLTISRPYKFSEYYADMPGAWWGQGAARLGLEGTVQQPDFDAALEGRDPRTGEVLVPPATATRTHRPGWDLTFSAPKSISIMALVGKDERLIWAHEEAVRRTLAELERFAQSRAFGGTERVITGNLIVAIFRHDISRALEPNLHDHAVTMNLTQRADGEWRALEPRELFRLQRYGTAVYRSELAGLVEPCGYELRVGRDGQPELAFITPTICDAYSTRSQQIKAFLAAHGVQGAQAQQIAAWQTREPRPRDVDMDALRRDWEARVEGIGALLATGREAAEARIPMERSAEERELSARAAVAFAIEHTTERQSVVNRLTLEKTALERDPVGANLAYVRQEITRLEQTGELLRATEGPERFTTPEMVRAEHAVIQQMRDGQGQLTPLGSLPRDHSVRASLTPQQERAVAHILHSHDRVLGLEGRAGTGKTMALCALAQEAEARGVEVRGFAVTTSATGELRKAGLQSETVARAIQSPTPRGSTSGRRALWLVDETSLLSTRQAEALQSRAAAANAQLVHVADRRQHYGVEAGAPFPQLVAAGMSIERLDTIQRQQDPELRQAVLEAADGRTREAIQRLDHHGSVYEIPDRDQRLAAVASAYVRHRETTPGETVLVIAPANADRRTLNAAIHTESQAHGQVDRQEYAGQVLVGRDLTGAERKVAGSYEPENRVFYARGSRTLGLARDRETLVVDSNSQTNTVTVRQNGKEVTYDPRRFYGADVYRLEPRPFAQGERVEFRRQDREHGIPNGALGRIESLTHETGQARIALDDGRTVPVALSQPTPLDHGYAVTSHRAQGKTVDQVLLHVDTRQSAELVNERQTYVSISRARHSAVIYTDDRERLPNVAARPQERESALHAIEPEQVRTSGGRPADRPAPGQGPEVQTGVDQNRAQAPGLTQTPGPGMEQEPKAGQEHGQAHDQAEEPHHEPGTGQTQAPRLDANLSVTAARETEANQEANQTTAGQINQPRATESTREGQMTEKWEAVHEVTTVTDDGIETSVVREKGEGPTPKNDQERLEREVFREKGLHLHMEMEADAREEEARAQQAESQDHDHQHGHEQDPALDRSPEPGMDRETEAGQEHGQEQAESQDYDHQHSHEQDPALDRSPEPGMDREPQADQEHGQAHDQAESQDYDIDHSR